MLHEVLPQRAHRMMGGMDVDSGMMHSALSSQEREPHLPEGPWQGLVPSSGPLHRYILQVCREGRSAKSTNFGRHCWNQVLLCCLLIVGPCAKLLRLFKSQFPLL